MKRMIAVISFAVIITTAGIFESLYIQKTFSFLEGQAEIIEEKLAADDTKIDTEENIGAIKDLHKEWQKKTKVLKFFVWHTGIKDVEVGLARIQSYTEENNYTEAHVELTNLIDYTRHYKEDYKFSIQNIF